MVYCDHDSALTKNIQEKASLNVKRIQLYDDAEWMNEQYQSPYFINDFQEIKTTWHPIDTIAGGGNKY